THLECSATGESLDPTAVHGVSPAGKPILVRYDLDGVNAAVSPAVIESRPPDMWKYRELLPVAAPDHIVSLGETATPLIDLPCTPALLAARPALRNAACFLPSGVSRALRLALSVFLAQQLPLRRLAMPTLGTVGAVLASYGSRVGM